MYDLALINGSTVEQNLDNMFYSVKIRIAQFHTDTANQKCQDIM